MKYPASVRAALSTSSFLSTRAITVIITEQLRKYLVRKLRRELKWKE
jgi:hypothetical protein